LKPTWFCRYLFSFVFRKRLPIRAAVLCAFKLYNQRWRLGTPPKQRRKQEPMLYLRSHKWRLLMHDDV
jgi:hypothetical protein